VRALEHRMRGMSLCRDLDIEENTSMRGRWTNRLARCVCAGERLQVDVQTAEAQQVAIKYQQEEEVTVADAEAMAASFLL